MNRRLTDPTITTAEWISLNLEELPTSLVERMVNMRSPDGGETLVIERIDARCETCHGTGFTEDELECATCDGDGDDPEHPLHAFPFAWGTCWKLRASEVTDTRTAALISSGFVVWRVTDSDIFDDGDLIIGIDGGGYTRQAGSRRRGAGCYSFHGAHWIPLRLRLAHAWCFGDYGPDNGGEVFDDLVNVCLEAAAREGEGDENRIARLVAELGR